MFLGFCSLNEKQTKTHFGQLILKVAFIDQCHLRIFKIKSPLCRNYRGRFDYNIFQIIIITTQKIVMYNLSQIFWASKKLIRDII